jgi:hypothetical protein
MFDETNLYYLLSIIIRIIRIIPSSIPYNPLTYPYRFQIIFPFKFYDQDSGSSLCKYHAFYMTYLPPSFNKIFSR